MERQRSRPDLPPIPAPARFVQRRQSFRREEDRAVHEERALVACALDVLAGPSDAATQVAEILALVARVVGARRAALVIDQPERRVLVGAARGESLESARALASWLDAHGPRPASARAAARPAEVVVVRTQRGRPGIAAPYPIAPPGERYVSLGVEGSDALLGLELAKPGDGPAVAARLPATTLRHLVTALAAASGRAAGESEREELRARERERERFVSMVAHELRTPLTGLGGYLDLLADGAVDDPEVGREFIERGRGIVEQMAELVGDLLELSRLEAGSLRLEVMPISLAEACERAMAAVAPIAAGQGIRLMGDMPPRLRTVRADRRRVEQVVTNLVGNACKFTPRGGVVEVCARIDGQVALVVVRDDGPGIERSDRERVFRPFARLEDHGRVPGTGLGLPISRDLARAMGGDVDLASVAGSGSAFVLGLPAAQEATRPLVEAAVATALEREEVGLEERAVLRAMRSNARSATADPGDPRPGARRGPAGEARPAAGIRAGDTT